MLKQKILLILSGVSLITSCASMFGDNTRKINVDSNPRDAGIYIEGHKHGVTPAVVTLPTYIYGTTNIILKKTNYDDIIIPINSEFQLVSLWNLLNGFGFLIDLADGDIVKIDPQSLNVHRDLGPPKS